MEGGDASAGGADTVVAPTGDGMSTVYNGSVPCVGCGTLLGPVAAMYAPDNRCYHCRKKRHHRHVKSRMSGH